MTGDVRQRVYGKNSVFCNGRFISGPDSVACMATTLLVCLPSLLWHVEVVPFFIERHRSYAMLPIIGVVLQVSTVVLLLCAAFFDPGIVPRQGDYTKVFDVRTNSYRTRMPSQQFEICLNGFLFRVKYCTTCNLYRPPRCSHCAVCENCVERFDHHCPWIGNCVGKRNYWLFYSFVTLISVLTVFVLATSFAEFVILCRQHSDNREETPGDNAFVVAMNTAPMCVAIMCFTGAVVWFPLSLWSYHTYLVCINQTTYEHVKEAYGSNMNPFNHGVARNFRDVLCSPVRPRLFDVSTMQLLWPKVEPDRCIIPSDTSDIEFGGNNRKSIAGAAQTNDILPNKHLFLSVGAEFFNDRCQVQSPCSLKRYLHAGPGV